SMPGLGCAVRYPARDLVAPCAAGGELGDWITARKFRRGADRDPAVPAISISSYIIFDYSSMLKCCNRTRWRRTNSLGDQHHCLQRLQPSCPRVADDKVLTKPEVLAWLHRSPNVQDDSRLQLGCLPGHDRWSDLVPIRCDCDRSTARTRS